MNLSSVPPDMNIASYVLHIHGATSNGMTYSFVPYYSMGVTSRNLASDQLCEADHEGDRFAECNRDVTGFSQPPDSMPPADFNGMNNFAKAGDESMSSDEIRRLAAAPVLDVTEVLPAVITSRAAVCHGRPESPGPQGSLPWPDAPADCPSWCAANPPALLRPALLLVPSEQVRRLTPVPCACDLAGTYKQIMTGRAKTMTRWRVRL
jgi:hypothetical protein